MRWPQQEGIETKKWPGNSPDLNLFENLWHIFKMKREEKQCSSLEEMKRDIKFIWHMEITQELCKALARLMPNRLQAVINAHGGHTQ